jgi:hypothetical protein
VKRKTYNDYNDDWFKAHPHLMAMRQLAGVDDAQSTEDAMAREYAQEQSAPDDEDIVRDCRDIRGK